MMSCEHGGWVGEGVGFRAFFNRDRIPLENNAAHIDEEERKE